MLERFDFVVIGAGIAGSSAAALIADERTVLLIEQEEQPGYHSTGRSAALFSTIYGNGTVRALSRASRDFLYCPPHGFASASLVRRRGTLFIATQSQVDRLHAFAALPDVGQSTRLVSPEEMKALCSILHDDHCVAGLYEPGSADLDVNAIHQGYLRMLRSRGGIFRPSSRVVGLERRKGHWLIRTEAFEVQCSVIINAAGAWADDVAAMAGARASGLQPLQRTACLVDPPPGLSIDEWPLVIDVDEQFYVKPDAGLLLISPADETLVSPSDVQPEELDVATGVYRAEAAMKLEVHRVKRSWAGLRSFLPDRTPLVGYDPAVEGFFWLAGQGGYGIQTAPAMALAARSLALGLPLPAELADHGVITENLSPARLRASAAD